MARLEMEPLQPTQMGLLLPGAASLVEQIDKRILIVLRDGRHLVGILRSFDQFSNMVLEDTHERHIANGLRSDMALGLFIVRGENIVLLGELDPEKESSCGLTDVEPDQVLEAERTSATPKVEWDFENL